VNTGEVSLAANPGSIFRSCSRAQEQR